MKKLCFSSLNCPELTHEEMVRLAKAYGLYGIELRGKTAAEHISPDTPESRLSELRKLYKENGVAVAGVTSYVKLADVENTAENVETLKRYASLAESMDAEYVRVYYGKGCAPSEDALCDAIGKACETVRGTNVRLLMEIHDELKTAAQAAALFGAAGSPQGFGYIYNTLYAFRFDEGPRASWETAGPYTGATHINPHRFAAANREGDSQCLPQDCDYNLRGLLDIIDESAFCGPNVIMWETPFDPDLKKLPEVLPAFMRYLH
ncbi:MAG: TIM barrel protein [Lachnospiraceae bacterium]|nr:TIM barrel protein [Lachnospiraceae bacterium]